MGKKLGFASKRGGAPGEFELTVDISQLHTTLLNIQYTNDGTATLYGDFLEKPGLEQAAFLEGMEKISKK